MDTPNKCNVEGNNNKLTSGLQSMGCDQNPCLLSFRFRNCIFYTGSYLVLFYEANHSSLNTLDKFFRSNILDIFMASTTYEKQNISAKRVIASMNIWDDCSIDTW